MAKKPAITGVARPQGLDDIAKEIGKAVNRYGAMRRLGHGVGKSAKKAAKGSQVSDIYGSAYKKAKAVERNASKAGRRSSRKPAEITVNVGRKSSSVKKVTARKLVAGENGRPPVRGGRVKIDSKPKIYNETYTKGTKEYKDALKAQRRDARALKKVNKPSYARSERSMEYRRALRAEMTNNRKVVDDFVNMSPRKVKSGKRPAVKSPKRK